MAVATAVSHERTSGGGVGTLVAKEVKSVTQSPLPVCRASNRRPGASAGIMTGSAIVAPASMRRIAVVFETILSVILMF